MFARVIHFLKSGANVKLFDHNRGILFEGKPGILSDFNHRQGDIIFGDSAFAKAVNGLDNR